MSDEDRFVVPARLPDVLEGRTLLDVYEESGSWFMSCTTVAKHCTRCEEVTSWTSYCDVGTSRGSACNVCNGTESRTRTDSFAATMSEADVRAVLAAHPVPAQPPRPLPPPPPEWPSPRPPRPPVPKPDPYPWTGLGGRGPGRRTRWLRAKLGLRG